MKKVEINVNLVTAIVWLFLAFWQQSGWYRIDCALGQQKACTLIAAEYDAKAKP
jgi:hypothetical protein